MIGLVALQVEGLVKSVFMTARQNEKVEKLFRPVLKLPTQSLPGTSTASLEMDCTVLPEIE